ncbi:MAG: hypothetical protein WC307_04395 [Candidatus Nanoarchaeia archaeon]
MNNQNTYKDCLSLSSSDVKMLSRDFEPGEIFVRCRICKQGQPKKDFPTMHKVCINCAHEMNWKLPEKKGRQH